MVRKQPALDLNGETQSGIISVFLNLERPEAPDVQVRLDSIEIKGDQDWIALGRESREISAKKIGAGQIFLARNIVPASSYEKLRLTFTEAFLADNNRPVPLSMQDNTLELLLPTSLELSKGNSYSVFITWDAGGSLEGTSIFSPKMTASLQAVPIIANLLFVACPEIDTVYIVRTDTNRVAASVGVSGKPTYVGLDPLNDRLYILAAEESAIKVVELTTNQVVDKIFISLDNKPNFMTLSSDGRAAYVLDSRGNILTLVDLTTGTTTQREIVNYYPEYAVFLQGEEKLAVSLNRSNEVNLLDPLTLAVTARISTGNSPLGLAGSGDVLYIAESLNNSVLAYDIKAMKQKEQIEVGFTPARILAVKNKIYVANAAGGSISVIEPQIFQVINEIPVAGEILELTASINHNWLYVGNVDAGGITVLDLNSSRIGGFIDLAAYPLGMAVIE